MQIVLVTAPEPLAAAVHRLDVPSGRPVLVLIGGADGVGPDESALIDTFVDQVVVPVLRETNATMVDGGTNSGIMQSLGRAASAAGLTTPLVGVAVAALVGNDGDGQTLEPHHTHALLVDGHEWGDESQTLADVAGLLAAGPPTATVLINGGEVSRSDVAHSLRRGRTVVAVRHSGRLADQMAAEPPDGLITVDPRRPVEDQRRHLTALLSAGPEPAGPRSDHR